MAVWLICAEAQEQELGVLSPTFFVSRDLNAPPLAFEGIIDLLFEENEAAHLPLLANSAVPVVVASLLRTSSQLPGHFTRVNAWPGFLRNAVLEACTTDEGAKAGATGLLALLGKQPAWVPDLPGLVAARVVAAIINEAYLAVSEGVASRTDIDTAMQLGTNYPYGPFAWAQLLGKDRIAALLATLAATDSRYQPCALLLQEQ